MRGLERALKGDAVEFAVVDPDEAGLDPYPFVYVNEDGSARELTLDERAYLQTPFHPADGGRPWVKRDYDERNGWGKLAGFCPRFAVPESVAIESA
jgi:hypothetical protein